MQADSNILEQYILCPDCDLLLDKYTPKRGHCLSCPRCGKTLSKKTENSVTKVLALSFAGLLLYLPAMFLPLMTIESLGFTDSANIVESIVTFYQNGYYFVSFMVLLSAFVFPLILLSSIFAVSLNLKSGKAPGYLAPLLRMYLHVQEWAMVEVYLLGIMITFFKMVDSSEIIFHSGLICFILLVLLTLAISTVLDKVYFWSVIEHIQLERGKKTTIAGRSVSRKTATTSQHGLIHCPTCHQISAAEFENGSCQRCGEPLHFRKPNSISRTWALVITSVIFFFPANMLPIMRVDFLGIADRSTIMDGIIYFFQDGSYFIGLLIFSASIVVPVFKIVGLIILLLATRPAKMKFLRSKAKMYRFIAFIGRWSMLDIFVIALLTSMVDFGFFTSIHAAPAATYFCIVVAATMFAAITFDPRIMWDKCCHDDHSIENNKATIRAQL